MELAVMCAAVIG